MRSFSSELGVSFPPALQMEANHVIADSQVKRVCLQVSLMCNQCNSCVLHLLYCLVCCHTNRASRPTTSGAGAVCVIWSHGQTPPGQLSELRGKLAPPSFTHSQPALLALS